jgi:hypothetical protein
MLPRVIVRVGTVGPIRHIAVPFIRRAAPSALDRLREVTEQHGATLAPRLTIYPEMAADPERWLDPATWLPVLDRCDAEALGRDDPGPTSPSV